MEVIEKYGALSREDKKWPDLSSLTTYHRDALFNSAYEKIVSVDNSRRSNLSYITVYDIYLKSKPVGEIKKRKRK